MPPKNPNSPEWAELDKMYRQVLQANPNRLWVRGSYARLAVLAGQYPIAREQFNLIGSNGYEAWNNIKMFLARRAEAFSDGRVSNIEGAPDQVTWLIQAVNDALGHDPNDAYQLYARACGYQLQGQFDKAEQDFSRCLQLEPSFIEARCALAEMFFACGQLDRAMPVYRQILEWEPTHVESLNRLTYSLWATKQYEEGLRTAYRLIAAVPSKMQFYVMAISCAQGLKRWEEVVALGKRGLARGDTHKDQLLTHDLVCRMAMAFRHLNRNREEADAFRLAIEIKPDSKEANSQLALTYLLSDDLKVRDCHKALEPATRAVALSKEHDAICLTALGVAYEQLGRREEAQRTLDKALALNPKLKLALDHRAAVAGK